MRVEALDPNYKLDMLVTATSLTLKSGIWVVCKKLLFTGHSIFLKILHHYLLTTLLGVPLIKFLTLSATIPISLRLVSTGAHAM